MAAKKDTTPPDRRVVFTTERDGSFKATYTWRRYRFLMSDGSTVDVQAVRDDSDLRAAVLAATGVEAIAGVVTLPSPPLSTPEDSLPVRAPRKKIARGG